MLPAECAGCRTPHVPLRRGACASCAAALDALRPRQPAVAGRASPKHHASAAGDLPPPPTG
ncbi:hypothetical protein AB0H87_33195, partial [Asanoa sp. NPDC050611]